jgi:glycosyltransferase involved in cell wall biosynthesis
MMRKLFPESVLRQKMSLEGIFTPQEIDSFVAGVAENVAADPQQLQPSKPPASSATQLHTEAMTIFDSRFEKFVLIGKVEERKKQIEIVRSLSRPDLVDFIGPIQDRRFASLNQTQQQSFLGEWSRDKIKFELPKYRGLILLSDAEADALVLHEALAAGVEVFVSKNSLGSQEVSQFVHLVHSVEELEQLLTACLARKPVDSSIIRMHASNNSWEKQVAIISNLIYQSS